MRSSRRALPGVFMTLLVLFCACARNPGPYESRPTPRDRSALQAALETMVDSWNRDDLAGHVSVYADSATFTTPGGVLRSRASLRDMLRQGYATPDGLARTLGFTDREYRMLGPSHALVTAAFLVEDGRGDQDVEGRFTLVFERTARGWEIIHDHSG